VLEEVVRVLELVLVPSEVLVTADSMVGVEANEEALKNGQQ
jgi:hypothetical protein